MCVIQPDVSLCIYHLFVLLNSNHLAPLRVDLPCPPSRVESYSLSVRICCIQIVVIDGLTLSLHDLHLLFWCVFCNLALIWLVLIALFCAALWKKSVSHVRFPFLGLANDFSCDMSLISRLKRPNFWRVLILLFSSYFLSIPSVGRKVFILINSLALL